MENRISMKLCVDIMCRMGTCRSIQSYSPGGATFPDCFASFINPVSLTMVSRSAVFLPNWARMRPYYWSCCCWIWTGQSLLSSSLHEFESLLKVHVACSFNHIRQVAPTRQERASHSGLWRAFLVTLHFQSSQSIIDPHRRHPVNCMSSPRTTRCRKKTTPSWLKYRHTVDFSATGGFSLIKQEIIKNSARLIIASRHIDAWQAYTVCLYACANCWLIYIQKIIEKMSKIWWGHATATCTSWPSLKKLGCC